MRTGVTRLAALVAAGLLAAACGTATSPPHSQPRPGPVPSVTPSVTAAPETPAPPQPADVLVNGVPVRYVAAGTVASALSAAGLTVRDGRLLSVVTHRILNAHAAPATVQVDGDAADLLTVLHPGAVVIARSGADRVESTRNTTISVPADPTGTGLYAGGTPGAADAVVGAISGEVASRTVTRLPVLGHLTRPGTLALTIDDGPDATWTPQVLAVLAAHHVRATFCLIGREVQSHAALARAEVAAGHLLCDHTLSHDQRLPTRDASTIHDQIALGAAAITAATGVHPAYFRAPGGNWSPQIESDARALGMTPLHWTVDPRDWSRPGATAIAMRVFEQARPGGVLLLHDGGGDRSETVAALGTILDRLGAAGYVFTPPKH